MEKIRIRDGRNLDPGSRITSLFRNTDSPGSYDLYHTIFPVIFFSPSRSEPSATPVVSASPLATPTNRVSAAAAAGPITTATPILSSAGAHYSAGKPVARVVPGRIVPLQILESSAKFWFPIQLITLRKCGQHFFKTLYVEFRHVWRLIVSLKDFPLWKAYSLFEGLPTLKSL